MRMIKASEFKAKCLKVMDEVAQSGEPLAVTKNGKSFRLAGQPASRRQSSSTFMPTPLTA